MARGSRFTTHHPVEVFDDHAPKIKPYQQSPVADTDGAGQQTRFDILADIDYNIASLPPISPTLSLDSLAADLKSLRIKDSPRKQPEDFPPASPISRRRHNHSSADVDLLSALEVVQEESESSEDLSSSAVTLQGSDQSEKESSIQQLTDQSYSAERGGQSPFPDAVAKHQAATPLDGDEHLLQGSLGIVAEETNMTTSQVTQDSSREGNGPNASTATPLPASEGSLGNETAPANLGTNTPSEPLRDEDKAFAANTPSRSAAAPVSIIEDSVEALDKLEEELEALDAATHFQRLLSPDKRRRQRETGHPSPTAKPATLSRTSSVTRRPTSRAQSSTLRVQSTDSSRSTVRRSTSMLFGKDAETRGSQDFVEDKVPIQDAPKRARPASLLPPKPPVKSTKAPTRPNFELPGEAVARRLKEQREARLSLHINLETIPAVTLPQRAKSTKAPTRPTFELPGEAISRRKREEREAKLRAQEENERQRREFKARPMRASIIPSAVPRETVASRARQNKVVGDDNVPKRTNSVGGKRVSVLITPSPTTSTAAESSRSPQLRGRGAAQSSSMQESRATSTSTGSISGQRSTLSAEEAHQQKLRGKEIFQHDNSYTGERERERRERELATKTAREQAAERSRQASREWAEKQRRKQLAAASAAASALTA